MYLIRIKNRAFPEHNFQSSHTSNEVFDLKRAGMLVLNRAFQREGDLHTLTSPSDASPCLVFFERNDEFGQPGEGIYASSYQFFQLGLLFRNDLS